MRREVNSAQVSRASQLLDEELEVWRTRPLGEMPYLVLDARYEKVRHGGHIVDVALLIAVGVQADGKRSVLGVSVSLSEAEVHWRTFLAALLERGLHGVSLIVNDDLRPQAGPPSHPAVGALAAVSMPSATKCPSLRAPTGLARGGGPGHPRYL